MAELVKDVPTNTFRLQNKCFFLSEDYLKSSLSSWKDIDIAVHAVGVSIGIFMKDTTHNDYKDTIWNNNEASDTIFAVMNKMERVGLLEKNDDHQYRYKQQQYIPTDWQGRPLKEKESPQKVVPVWEISPHIQTGPKDSLIERSYQRMLSIVKSSLEDFLEAHDEEELRQGITITFRLIDLPIEEIP